MWHGPRKPRQQCSMEQIQSSLGSRLDAAGGPCRYGFAAQGRQALLQFPPPPNYPPPFPSTSKMSSDEHLNIPGPSTIERQSDGVWQVPDDYSYAYYVPGPPTRHTNIPSRYPGTYREGTYRTRHTYLTRYGTEENIYEEISEVARARMRPLQPHQVSMMSINQSLVEEEVRRVQSGHRRVIGELNLSVEAMLMPSSSREDSEGTDREGETGDLADLLTIGPTDDLLSPVPHVDLDSGFSGSSSGASYRSAAGSLRRGPERPKSTISTTGHRNSTLQEARQGRSFWGKKAWRKLTGFPSNISLNKQKVTFEMVSKKRHAGATGYRSNTDEGPPPAEEHALETAKESQQGFNGPPPQYHQSN